MAEKLKCPTGCSDVEVDVEGHCVSCGTQVIKTKKKPEPKKK